MPQYVGNSEQILLANQSLKNKIEYLETERYKQDHYLSDLRQNLHLNKQTLKLINRQGPNDQVVATLLQQNTLLTKKLHNYYEQFQSNNALLLMQKQMRLDDRLFYNERMNQFENKIVDLRKYLHDKQDSFSSVIQKLKKYQQLNYPTLQQSLAAYKKDIGDKHVNQFLNDLIKQKNYYKKLYEEILINNQQFTKIKQQIIKKYPESQNVFNSIKFSNYKIPSYHDLQIDLKRKIQPNRQLIKLLKKQKITKELQQQALNQAIQKNQELVNIKNTLEAALNKIRAKYKLLNAQNSVLSLRIAEYDRHYCRNVCHNIKYYQEGQTVGLRKITEQKIRQYAQAAEKYFGSCREIKNEYLQKMKDDIQKWSNYICDSVEVKNENLKRGVIFKSCSVPNLLIDYQLQDELNSEMLIEQY